jgi:histidinol dehydrogenase
MTSTVSSGAAMAIPIKRWSALTADDKRYLVTRSEQDISAVRNSVADIIRRVREDGDMALRRYTQEYDNVCLGDRPLQVQYDEFQHARSTLDGKVKDAIEFAVENVRSYHAHQVPQGLHMTEIRPGILAGERPTPIPSVALYVPRGRGSFPSMLYMMAVPARLAQVPRICILTPPGDGGAVDPACLYAADVCGVREIYRVGGAQAVAAVAFGTETIRSVDKIVGPGSMYVTAAKRLVSEQVDIGLPAGPSESIVMADGTADPWRVTLDLMVEAEHGSDSAALLITDSPELAEAVASLIPQITEELPEPRKSYVTDVFAGYGGIIVTDTMRAAAEVVNEFAPEHLQIQTQEPFEWLPEIRHAGEILLGQHVPFSVANYAAGANAVLPTGGHARTFSAVSVRDFVKYSSVVYATQRGYDTLADPVATLARYEGFVTHAAALERRDERTND